MRLFGPRQAVDETARAELAQLRDEVVRAQSVVRQIEQEAIAMHDQVRRWMRRAVAAERAVLRNQEPPVNGMATPAAHAPAVVVPPLNRVNLRGARARIAARRQLEAQAEFLRHVSEGEPAPSRDALPAPDVEVPEAKESTEGD